ncbi:hypothetical protein JCM19047_808 [Bacillus sp. JCM 19047]|nr:hypothetical protein JCM19047_808 [Bacillus sp. JCM 19047]
MFIIGTLFLLTAIAISGILFLIYSFTSNPDSDHQVEVAELVYLLPLVPVLIYLVFIYMKYNKGEK